MTRSVSTAPIEPPRAPVSVVMPVHDGEATLEPALRALVAALPPGGEIVVVDDASTDDTAAIA